MLTANVDVGDVLLGLVIPFILMSNVYRMFTYDTPLAKVIIAYTPLVTLLVKEQATDLTMVV